MAGLNFQTATIINTADDAVIKDNVLLIKDKGITLSKDNVVRMVSKSGADYTPAKITVDFTNIFTSDDKYGRIEVYITTDGAEPAMMSTAVTQKGYPFWVEFAVDANVATTIKELFEKHNIFTIDKNVIKATVSGKVLTLESNYEYIRFGSVNIYAIDETGNEVKKASYKSPLAASSPFTLTVGTNGFGTYKQLIKDLRLPTAANLAWGSPRSHAMPVPGAIYNQYIIDYADTAANDGIQAVGERMKSYTTHVLWVKQGVTITGLDNFNTESTALED